MNQEQTTLIYLFNRYKNGSATGIERKSFLDLVSRPGMEALLKGLIDQELGELDSGLLLIDKEQAQPQADAMLQRILGLPEQQVPVIPLHETINTGKWWKIAAAACIAGLIGFIAWNYVADKPEVAASRIATAPADIQPGKQGAVLTLADGRTIILDSAHDGTITEVATKSGNQLSYVNSGTEEAVYNTVTTPRGRKYQLLLADGSKVWLNAASSIRYPTVFTGDMRQVNITGEAFFEVSENARQPFIVDVNNKAHIRVLGTQFNVNAYENEAAIQTTVIEGSVRFVSQDSVTLRPGQQAILTTRRLSTDKKADIEKVTAWKRGIFNFEDATLEEVMRQIERWYDIDVVYAKGIPDIRFGGKVSNDLSLSGLLKSLQESEVHFKVEGRKLIVLP